MRPLIINLTSELLETELCADAGEIGRTRQETNKAEAENSGQKKRKSAPGRGWKKSITMEKVSF